MFWLKLLLFVIVTAGGGFLIGLYSPNFFAGLLLSIVLGGAVGWAAAARGVLGQ